MEKQLEKVPFTEINRAITDGIVNDLNNYLAAIKGRTYLMKHSVHESNPIQKHLDEIIYCINESIETADILSSFSQVDEDFDLIE
ncbi:MAG: hypothetical protein KKE44_20870 [Proteobacteria bacterium]|nr:hypothetical protein [Pseudomonadota bacterium]MBU1585185.1 hypothetical protein [Pseudomonadota bacterium]MBU2454498.1 hypothetical protein [Pseudomonadota bacterium]MBU2629075.1 hypothetical protein [Pseudomonadota bacterium]